MSAQTSTGPSTSQPPRIAWPVTLGASVFVSGFFLLAVAGREFGPSVYALVLAGAAAVAVPILAAMLLVAWTEALTGRAWAGGFRPLAPMERARAGVVRRGVRYAAVLWLVNGGSFWVATLLGRL